VRQSSPPGLLRSTKRNYLLRKKSCTTMPPSLFSCQVSLTRRTQKVVIFKFILSCIKSEASVQPVSLAGCAFCPTALCSMTKSISHKDKRKLEREPIPPSESRKTTLKTHTKNCQISGPHPSGGRENSKCKGGNRKKMLLVLKPPFLQRASRRKRGSA